MQTCINIFIRIGVVKGRKERRKTVEFFLIIQKEKNGYDIYINNTDKHLYDNFSVK